MELSSQTHAGSTTSPSQPHPPLGQLSTLAARSFATYEEAVDAVLTAITDLVGARTSYVTRISTEKQELEVRIARNLPGGSQIMAGDRVALEDTY